MSGLNGGSAAKLKAILRGEDSGEGAFFVKRATAFVSSVAEMLTLEGVPDGCHVFTQYNVVEDDGGGSEYTFLETPIGTHDGVEYFDGVTGQFVLKHNGEISAGQAGFVSDWNGVTGTDNTAQMLAVISNQNIKKLAAKNGSYWFGSITGNAIKFLVERDIEFDFGWSTIACQSANDSGYTDTKFFQFRDCKANIKNYVFDDIGFDFLNGPSRGAMPVSIHAVADTIHGHNVGPFHIVRGQSMLTVTSGTPATYRSKGIALNGSCTADEVYYCVNLVNNGDDCHGQVRTENVNRMFFVYGVSGANLEGYCETGQAASANCLVSSSGSSAPETKSSRIVARFGTINGPLVIADQPSANGTGTYRNLDITFEFDAIGSNLTTSSNLVNIGAFDGSSSYYTTEKSITIDKVKVTLIKPASAGNFSNPVKVHTPSPNYGLLELNEESGYARIDLFPTNSSGVYMGPVVKVGDNYFRSVAGDLTDSDAVVRIPTEFLSPKNINAEVACILRVQAGNAVGGSNQYTLREYLLIGTLSSGGLLTFVDATQIATRSTGGLTPTITIAASGDQTTLNVSANTYTNSTAFLTASVRYL